MKIIYLIKQELQIYPPCLSQIQYLKSFGLDIIVAYGSCDKNVSDMLENKGIKCIDLQLHHSNGKLYKRIYSIFEYRLKAFSLIKEEYEIDDIIWFGTADSAFLLREYIRNRQFVFNVLELYDTNSFYRKNIGKIIYDSKAVISCEETRADIMRCWWNLEKKPYVLPNKPYTHPQKKNLVGTIDVTCEMISHFSNKISILYQGIFSKDRDICKLAQALNELKLDIDLYLMGNDKNGDSNEIKKIYNNTTYLGFAPAPFHLEVTSHATIGVALYDNSSLNNLFCAPNKIYEYCGFGIPVLGCDVPGLKSTIDKYQAGICVDFNNVNAIKEGILKMIDNYKFYSDNAKLFYNATNNEQKMYEIVSELGMPISTTEKD